MVNRSTARYLVGGDQPVADLDGRGVTKPMASSPPEHHETVGDVEIPVPYRSFKGGPMRQRRARVCRRPVPVDGLPIRVCISDWRASFAVFLADEVPDITLHGASERP